MNTIKEIARDERVFDAWEEKSILGGYWVTLRKGLRRNKLPLLTSIGQHTFHADTIEEAVSVLSVCQGCSCEQCSN